MIEFKNIAYRNILSAGNNWSDIDLNLPGKTLIMGKNGHGKSLILDAIVFALYGKPFRKINKGQLVNTRNKSGLEVKISFVIGETHYEIHRGIKPNIFKIYIDGVLQDQDAAVRDQQTYLEKNILGMSLKAFTQVVILGSATYTPFMELTAAQRRVVVEDFLDLGVLSEMGKEAKQRLNQVKDTIVDINHKIDRNRVKLEEIEKGQKALEEQDTQRLDEIAEQETQIKADIEEQKRKGEALGKQYRDLKASFDEDAVVELVRKLADKNDMLSKGKAHISRNEKTIEFYEHNSNCPTCMQSVEKEFADEIVKKKKESNDTVQEGIKKLEASMEKIRKSIVEVQSVEAQMRDLKGDMYVVKGSIDGLERQISNLRKMRDGIEKTSSAKNRQAEIDKVNGEIAKLVDDREKLTDRREMLDVVNNALKDNGTKAAIVAKYVPLMNEFIQDYLNQLGLPVTFVIDNTFSETITTPNFDTYVYSSFSEGEKLRIDLALLFTWRRIAQMRSATSTNLLILDEIMDSSLDDTGTEEFLRIINRLVSDSSVFVISHKGDNVVEKFENVITVVKEKGFSSLEKTVDNPAHVH